MRDDKPLQKTERQMIADLTEARADIAAGRIYPIGVALERIDIAYDAGVSKRRVVDGAIVEEGHPAS